MAPKATPSGYPESSVATTNRVRTPAARQRGTTGGRLPPAADGSSSGRARKTHHLNQRKGMSLASKSARSHRPGVYAGLLPRKCDSERRPASCAKGGTPATFLLSGSADDDCRFRPGAGSPPPEEGSHPGRGAAACAPPKKRFALAESSEGASGRARVPSCRSRVRCRRRRPRNAREGRPIAC